MLKIICVSPYSVKQVQLSGNKPQCLACCAVSTSLESHGALGKEFLVDAVRKLFLGLIPGISHGLFWLCKYLGRSLRNKR